MFQGEQVVGWQCRVKYAGREPGLSGSGIGYLFYDDRLAQRQAGMTCNAQVKPGVRPAGLEMSAGTG